MNIGRILCTFRKPKPPAQDPARYACSACLQRANQPDDPITVKGNGQIRTFAICGQCRNTAKGQTLIHVKTMMTNGFLGPRQTEALINELERKYAAETEQAPARKPESSPSLKPAGHPHGGRTTT